MASVDDTIAVVLIVGGTGECVDTGDVPTSANGGTDLLAVLAAIDDAFVFVGAGVDIPEADVPTIVGGGIAGGTALARVGSVVCETCDLGRASNSKNS